jgi:Prokaryotic E2 family D
MTTQSASMQTQLYGIGVFEEEIILSDFTGEAEKRFCVTPEQLMGFFRADIVLRPFPGLVWMKASGTDDAYLLTFPAKERTILYRHGKKIVTRKMSVPALAVKATFSRDKKVTQIHMWAFAGKELNATTQLYELPLPNVSGSDLCLGSTERRFGHDVREAVEKTIFDTPFNHHRYIVGKEKLKFLDYVRKYKGRCPFATLNKLGTGRQLLEARI